LTIASFEEQIQAESEGTEHNFDSKGNGKEKLR
jgi:hypothetical protein